MTKEQIKEAIKHGYKNVGVPETVIDGLAALGVTVVKDESEIDAYVQGEAVKGVMRTFQSETDKVRTEYSAKLKGLETEKAELEAKLNGNQPEPDKKPAEGNSEISELIKLMQEQNEQMRKQNEALTARFDAFEAERNSKNALADAEAAFKGNDYVKKYGDEAADAWERATELYEATGKKWTAEELGKKAMGYFNKAVAKRGVDTTKPLPSDGEGGADLKSRFEAFAKRQAERVVAVAD